MILVPHAGYVFSGKTAAHAYTLREGSHFDTVLLIGPPHRVAINGAVVYCGDRFKITSKQMPLYISIQSMNRQDIW